MPSWAETQWKGLTERSWQVTKSFLGTSGARQKICKLGPSATCWHTCSLSDKDNLVLQLPVYHRKTETNLSERG